MHRTINVFLGAISLLSIVSCNKFLDVNTNPNQSTTQTPPKPENILPQALAYTASNVSAFNSYGAEIGGYAANAGGYGGFGSAVTYQFSTGDFSGLWTGTYDNLEDYQSIITQTTGDSTHNYFLAAAMIMKAYNTQLLVDAYNDIPYSEALAGADKLTPVYDKAQDVYKNITALLDTAVNLINVAKNPVALGSSDILFSGDITKWKQLANTIKLRLILRGGSNVDFINKDFTSDGFLTTDAIVNPGYARDNGKQNPLWNTWAYSYTGGAGNAAWIPSKFIMAFYNGTKLADAKRGTAIYYQFPNTVSNQLGNGDGTVPKSPTGSAWYSGSNRSGSSADNSIGILKGPGAGMPILLASESYFLQAEANLKGLTGSSSDAAVNFNKGIVASFNYLYTLPTNQVQAGLDPAADAQQYLSNNTANYLVNFNKASTAAQQLEAIITQKYIAVNFINSQEGWNEYRRTGYPKTEYIQGAAGATSTFASTQSASTRADKLPTRILYPNTEYSYNASNVPKDITPFGTGVFWALQ